MKTVGIPKALLYHKFGSRWKDFFEILGFSVIFSGNTNKQILNEGLKISSDESCLPLKVYLGHVLDLKGKADFLFIPRYVSLVKGARTCPKMIGLPDMVKHSVKGAPRIISPTLNKLKGRLVLPIFLLALRLSKNPIKSVRATKKFFSLEPKKGNQIKKEKGMLNIGIVSHSYVLGDDYINLDIKKELAEKGVNVFDTEQVDQDIIVKENNKIGKQLYWSFEREILGSAYYFIENKDIDGIIHFTAFACGPDSVVAELIKDYAHKNKKPYLKLSLDEQTGKAGFVTRLEAFIDMIKRPE